MIVKLTKAALAVAARAAAAAGDFDETVLDGLPGMGDATPAIGSNIDGNSVFSNYIKLIEDGQFFLSQEGLVQYETPAQEALSGEVLLWCANIESGVSSMDSPLVGYTANCVFTIARNTLKNMTSAGAQLAHITPNEFLGTRSLSAVYVPQTNIIEGHHHSNTDNNIHRFWDDGRSMIPYTSWEVHDEGDTHPNAATSSWSSAGKMSWISAEDMGILLNNNASDFTPKAFDNIYKEVWTAHAPHAETLEKETSTNTDITNITKDEVGESNSTDNTAANKGDADEDEDAVDVFDATMLDALSGTGNSPPVIGSNINGNSVFTNYIKLQNDGQFFMLKKGISQNEKPGSEIVSMGVFYWCSNIEFTDVTSKDSSVVGYTANCVSYIEEDTLEDLASLGVHLAYDSLSFHETHSFSAVYVPHTNIFECHHHSNTDNLIYRFWDDGHSMMPYIGWEVHDEGSTRSIAASSSWSGVGITSWISAEEMASQLNKGAADFTPEAFKDIYKEVWTAHIPHGEALKDETSADADTTNSTKDKEGETNSTDNAESVEADADEDEDVLDVAILEKLPGMSKATPTIGSNIDGNSVFSNYMKLREDGQFFMLLEGLVQYETPASEVVTWRNLLWCANIKTMDFDSNDSPVVGYTANCVMAVLGNTLQNAASSLSQLEYTSLTPDEFIGTVSQAAIYYPQTNIFEGHYHSNADNFVARFWDDGRSMIPFTAWEVHDEAIYYPQTNIFEGNYHSNTDNFVARFWDDGRVMMPRMGWEVHDEGDTHPNAATSSASMSGEISWISAEEMGSILNNNATDFTPEAFDDIYKEVWATHAPHAETLNDETSTEPETTNSTENAPPTEIFVDGTSTKPEIVNGTMDGGGESNSTDNASIVDRDSNATSEVGGQDSSATETDNKSSGNGHKLHVAVAGVFVTLLAVFA
ncbi:hypothetical protein ACHAWF_011029 [Thalassiosira exigua]